jgi:hypothetical protein
LGLPHNGRHGRYRRATGYEKAAGPKRTDGGCGKEEGEEYERHVRVVTLKNRRHTFIKKSSTKTEKKRYQQKQNQAWTHKRKKRSKNQRKTTMEKNTG